MKLKNHFQSRFRHFGLISLTSLIAQILSLIALPIINSVYSISTVAIFGFIMTMASSFAPVATLKTESMFILPEYKHIRNQVLFQTLIRTCYMSLFLSVIISIYLITTNNKDSIMSLLIFCPLFLIFTSFGNILMAYAACEYKYHGIAKYILWRSLIGLSGAFLVGILTSNVIAFLGTQLLSMIIPLHFLLNLKSLLRVFRETKIDFAKGIQAQYRLILENVLSSIQNLVPLIYLQKTNRFDEIAFFYLFARLISGINAVTIEAFRPQMNNKIARYCEQMKWNSMGKYIHKCTITLFIFGITIGLLLFLKTDQLSEVFLSNRNQNDIIFLKMLVIFYFANIIYIPSYSFLIILKKQNHLLLIRSFSLAIYFTVLSFSLKYGTTSYNCFKMLGICSLVVSILFIITSYILIKSQIIIRKYQNT